MKVFFDGSIFSQQKSGGISRVGFELLKELSNKKDIEKIFYRGLYIDSYNFKKEWFLKYYGLKRPHFFTSRVFNLINNFGLDFFYNLNADKNLVYHSFYYRIPKKASGPVVVHCHDMMHELFNQNKKAIEFKKKAFYGADKIIAISESTKRDLLSIYPDIDEKKVSVIYLGASEVFSKSNPFKSAKPYMLYVGARNYKYKNFDLLLDCFLENKYFLDFDLIVVGGEDNVKEEHKDKISKVKVGRVWFFHKLCSDEELASLYSGASVFIYPSLYEGFGIPPLEAMAAGCPILASNRASMPEVIGSAGLLFNPEDKQEFKNKLETILRGGPAIENIKKLGLERVKRFSWQNSANELCNEYLNFF